MPPALCRRTAAAVVLSSLALCSAGCFGPSPSAGGGQAAFKGNRAIKPADVALPRGFRIEAVARGLTFPTGVAFDDQGRAYVTEAGYVYGEKWTTPRLLRVEPDGARTEIARGENPPWNGVDYRNGFFYVSEGGERGGGRIVRVPRDGGAPQVLVDNLPSVGDHHTNGPVVGPDSYVYFGQGTATNSGVVGADNAKFGWLARHPNFHDIPAQDVKLVGHNFKTRDKSGNTVETGAYLPYGTPSVEGQVIKGQALCTGAVLRVPAGGGDVEVVAWGLRNPYGLAFSPGGTLYVTENSYDVRGSRPVWGAGDVLWAIGAGDRGKWYGWPDFHGSTPLTKADHYGAPFRDRAPKFLLAEHPNDPPDPVVKFGVHSSSNGIDFSRDAGFGYEGQAFVAQFGDMAPTVGKVIAPVGFKIVRVDVRNGTIDTFATNRGKTGPASRLKRGGFERPTALRFSPDGSALYVVDFGVVTMSAKGPNARPGTGVLWRITREGAQ
jgi:glucose/arabinose dehydrogenase